MLGRLRERQKDKTMTRQASFPKRLSVLVYGALSYILFFGTFCYALGFVGNFVVAKSLDGPPSTDLGVALTTDLGLLALFALQHSGMARRPFKQWLTRFLPQAAERSTYVLLSSLALLLLFAGWQPLGGSVWQLESSVGVALMYGGFAFGWLLVLCTTFLIDHFDLFGLRQIWLYFRERPYPALSFVVPGPYRVVRHPLYFGWLCAFWFTPTMTVTHLLFAAATTLYILVAIRLEERDLLAAHGVDYLRYQQTTPMLIPGVGAREPAAAAQVTGR
jgi:methanethiol S-methyltransferase